MFGSLLNIVRVFHSSARANLKSDMDVQLTVGTHNADKADRALDGKDVANTALTGTDMITLQSIFDEKQTTIQAKVGDKIIVCFTDESQKPVQYTPKPSQVGTHATHLVKSDNSIVMLYETLDDRVERSAQELVVKLSADNVNAYTVIQRAKKYADTEAKQNPCKLLPLRLIDKDASAWSKILFRKLIPVQFAYVMQKMDCNLLQWLRDTRDEKSRLQHLDPIIASLEQQLNYLLRVDPQYNYADLKPENVGVLQNEDSIEVYLLDLESVVPYKDGQYTSTFPCCEEKKFAGFVTLKDERDKRFCMLFTLFILILFFVKVTDSESHIWITNKYSYKSISKEKQWIEKETRRTMKFFLDRVPDDIEIIFQLLEPEKFKTCTRILKELKHVLKSYQASA